MEAEPDLATAAQRVLETVWWREERTAHRGVSARNTKIVDNLELADINILVT